MHQQPDTIEVLETEEPPVPVDEVDQIVVRSVNWLGDVVMEIPLLKQIRRTFPEAELHVVIREAFSSLMRLVPEVDHVISFSKTGGLQETGWDLKLSRILRRSYQFDLAFIVPRSFRAALAPGLAGIPVRIGYDTGFRLVSHPLPSPDFYWEDHRVHYYLRLLSHWYEEEIPVIAPSLEVTSQLRQKVIDKLDLRFSTEESSVFGDRGVGSGKSSTKNNESRSWTASATGGNDMGCGTASSAEGSQRKSWKEFPTIAINAGASYGTAKRWSPKRYAVLANQLVRKRNARVLLLGSAAEQQYVERIQAVADRRFGKRGQEQNAFVQSLAGKTSVLELAGVLSVCDVLVSNDTGPKHVADAVDTPVVAIYGSTDPHGLHPYSGQADVLHEPVHCSPCWKRHCPIDHRCMTRISVPRVFEAVDDWLCR